MKKLLFLLIIAFSGIANAATVLIDDFTCAPTKNAAGQVDTIRNVVTGGGTHSYLTTGTVRVGCGTDVDTVRNVFVRINSTMNGNSSGVYIGNNPAKPGDVIPGDAGRMAFAPDLASQNTVSTDYAATFYFQEQAVTSASEIVIRYKGACAKELPIVVTLTTGQQLTVNIKPHDWALGIQTIRIPVSAFNKLGNGGLVDIPAKISGFSIRYASTKQTQIEFRSIHMTNSSLPSCATNSSTI